MLSIIVFIQYKQNVEQAVYKEIFVNHLYFQVDRCINAIPEEYENIKAASSSEDRRLTNIFEKDKKLFSKQKKTIKTKIINLYS